MDGFGAGLAALAFWGFIAAIVVTGIWDGAKKREAQHETLRRMIESGKPVDEGGGLMNDERNPALARLFGEADRKLDDETFVADVMARTRIRRTRPFVIAFVVLLVAAPVAWLFAGPLNDALAWLTQLLSRPIAGSGDGFTGPAVLPMNNIGAGLVLGLLALRAIARRLFTVVP